MEPRPFVPRQIPHVIHRVDAKALDHIAAQQAQITVQLLQPAALGQPFADPIHGLGIRRGQGHHTAPFGKRRLQPNHRRQRPIAFKGGHPSGNFRGSSFPQAEQLVKPVQAPLQRLHRALTRRQQRWHIGLPLLQHAVVPPMGDQQNIAVFGLVNAVAGEQGKARSRIARRSGHAGHGGQVGLHIGHRGLAGQHNCGLGQIGVLGKRKAGIGKRGQIGHGDVVIKPGEVDGRLRIQRRPQFHRLGGAAAPQVRWRDGKGKLHLVVATHHEGRNLHRRAGLAWGILHQGQQGADLALAVPTGVQAVRAQKLVIECHIQRPPIGQRGRRIPVLQLQGHAFGIPGK